jgi:hypothetical protein
MFPKEHGAWNALLVSLAAGWWTLGGSNLAAIALTTLWLSAFILKAPFSTFRQYRIADPSKAAKAGAWALFLFGILLYSAWTYWKQGPPEASRLILFTALPAGLLLFILYSYKRTLRFLFAEALGFLGLCLVAPALYLSIPAVPWDKAGLLYLLFGGYFLLGLLYVRVRFEWMDRAKAGERRKQGERRQYPRGFLDIWGILILTTAWIAAVFFFPGASPWQIVAPLYALARMTAGALWGEKLIHPMTLGMREMVHSIVFLVLALATWN